MVIMMVQYRRQCVRVFVRYQFEDNTCGSVVARVS